MTQVTYELAEKGILQPSELEVGSLQRVLSGVLDRQVDQADIYLQSIERESWFLEDGIVKDAGFSVDRGFGLRVISGEKTGFAFADEINQAALLKAAGSARDIVRLGQSGQVAAVNKAAAPALYPDSSPLKSLCDADKVAILQQIDQLARAADPRVTQVMSSLSASYHVVMVFDEQGKLTPDVRPLVSVHVQVIAESQGQREMGTAGGGGRGGYALVADEAYLKQLAEKAVRKALVALAAQPAPAGSMPVVLGPGWPGVLLHEAVGHGLEGDFNRRGSSAFSGRIGDRVASPLCTVVDDGSLAGRRGSLSVDDEGTQTGRTVLIENGVLKGYMQDRLNARLMGVQPTGNGRRESYACLPLPRMTNTFMLAGEHKPEEIIASVDRGLYAVDFSGGEVDITSGKFVFCASEAYLIEGGRVTAPVKGATLIGNGPDVLTKVSMVGDDMALDSGVGVCGKEGQSIPVGVGQPTLKVDELTVGGV